MKLLDGQELAGYIKERQAKQVRNLRQAHGVSPTLAIVQSTDDPVINTYVRMKQQYGDDILVDVVTHNVSIDQVAQTIQRLNNDDNVHGIIVQLPLSDASQTDHVVNMVARHKDVDGLAAESIFTPATAMGIDWLINGYNIDLRGKRIAIIGAGRLVGAPLARLWKEAGFDVTSFDEHSGDISKKIRRFTVVVSAAGVPNLVKSQSLQPGAIVIDAATSTEHGKIVGDISDDVRERADLTITPEKGGVGPLTVCALFDNVIRAARESADVVSGE